MISLSMMKKGEGGGETVTGHIDTLLCRAGSAQVDALGADSGADEQSDQKECCG